MTGEKTSVGVVRAKVTKALEAGKIVVVERDGKVLFIQKKVDDYWAWKGKVCYAFHDGSIPLYRKKKKSKHLITVDVILLLTTDECVSIVW